MATVTGTDYARCCLRHYGLCLGSSWPTRSPGDHLCRGTGPVSPSTRVPPSGAHSMPSSFQGASRFPHQASSGKVLGLDTG